MGPPQVRAPNDFLHPLGWPNRHASWYVRHSFRPGGIIKRLLILALAIGMPALATAQPIREMTPELIERAIVKGKAAAGKKISPGAAVWFTGGVAFGFETPYSRVFDAAKDAAEIMKPFGPGDVTEEMLVPLITVTALPQIGADTPAEAYIQNGVRRVVLISASGEVIQPLKDLAKPITAQNSYGAQVSSLSWTGSFKLSDLEPGASFRAFLKSEKTLVFVVGQARYTDLR